MKLLIVKYRKLLLISSSYVFQSRLHAVAHFERFFLLFWLLPPDISPLFFIPLEKPGSPTIRAKLDIQATSLTVEWTAPADDGGSPITAYRVVILKGSTEIKNENITDPGSTSLPVGGLERNTTYTVKVFASNAVFEGLAGEKKVRTKYEGNKL